MEFSFIDGEETSKQQLNSTALEQDDESKENEQNEWKLSPIVAERLKKSSIRKNNQENEEGSSKNSPRTDFKSPPLKTLNGEASGTRPTTSTEGRLEISTDLSSFIANNSVNHFDSILLTSLHKSINFSPRVVFSQESCSEQKDGEKFQWSVEQLAILKPAHISDDEIAASYRSPIPEVEEKIQEVLNEYWTNNVSYIPSPDGPRLIHLPHRDGTVTTIKCGEGASEGTTPSLLNMVRKKEAVKAAYATSSPKQRPRRNLKQMRNCPSQTELTIPPSVDLDIKRLLGDAFLYRKDKDDEEDEEVFNVSASSNFSTRRRLFSEVGKTGEGEECNETTSVDEEEEEQQMNETGLPFNDSLSPVRRSEDVTEDNLEDESASSAATRSHASQLAINISILNDCMMQSMDEEDASQEKNDEEENGQSGGCGAVGERHEEHFHSNEYEMLDRSSSSNATPRHEDLDWTPRRIGSLSIPSSSSRPQASSQQSEFRRFMFDMSPIHPHGTTMRTPIQRCHQVPRGFALDDDGEEEEEQND